MPQGKYDIPPQAEELIRKYYDSSGPMIDWLAKELGVSRQKIKEWASQLRQTIPEEYWTEDQEKLLRKMLPLHPPSIVADALHKTEVAVLDKAKRLKINKLTGGYTIQDLCKRYDCSDNKIHHWIRLGLLNGSRRKTGRGEKDYWYFSEAAVWIFEREYPNEIKK